MVDIDDVKRALVRADVRALADRTMLPEKMVMSMVANNGWDVAKAERDIHQALEAVAASITRDSNERMFGGNAGGGKSFTMSQAAEFRVRLHERYGAALERPNGVVLTCVS